MWSHPCCNVIMQLLFPAAVIVQQMLMHVVVEEWFSVEETGADEEKSEPVKNSLINHWVSRQYSWRTSEISKAAKSFACPASNLPAMLEIQGNIDDLFSRQDLMDDEKAKLYFQLQNRYLALKKTIEFKNTNTTRSSAVPELPSTQDSSTTPLDLQRNTWFKKGSHLTKTLSRTIYPTTTVKS